MVSPDLVSEEDIAKLIVPDDLPDEQPAFKAYIEAKVYDKEGHLIQHHKQPMRSLTEYFLGLMAIPIIGTYPNSSTASVPSLLANVLGLPSQITGNTGTANIAWNWSIQVGSGTQPFSPTLSGLSLPISNGTGAGQLSYSTVSVTYAGTSIFISVTVTNYTSNTVTVTEIGLQGQIGISYSLGTTNTYNFLLSYDTFSTPISIPGYGMATFQITLSFTG
jgi:hypothetical protein